MLMRFHSKLTWTIYPKCFAASECLIVTQHIFHRVELHYNSCYDAGGCCSINYQYCRRSPKITSVMVYNVCMGLFHS